MGLFGTDPRRATWFGLLAFALTIAGPPGEARAQGTLLAHYTFDDCSWSTSGTVTDTYGSYDGTVTGAVTRDSTATSGLKPETCGSGSFTGGMIDVYGLPVSTSNNRKTTVSFWMYWDGTSSVMPVGWRYYDIWIYGGSIGFNTAQSDIYGVSSSGLANGWHHIVAVFNNRNVNQSKLYIDGVLQSLSQRRGSPRRNLAYVNAHLGIGGWWGSSGYRFSGRLDEVKVYNGEVSQAQVNADYAAVTASCPSCGGPSSGATKIASYDFDGDWDSSLTLEDGVGSRDGTLSGSVSKVSAPASGSKPDTCSSGDFNGGKFDITGLAVNTSYGSKNSFTFWMKWDGSNSVIPMGFYQHDLWMAHGSFGFNSWWGDIYGISSSGLANTWKHVAVVFTNGNVHADRMWIDGVEQSLSQRRSIPNNSNAYANAHTVIGGVWYSSGYRWRGEIDEFNVYTGEITDAQVLADMNAACDDRLAEYEMEQASWSAASGQVIDSSANGYNATAIDGPSTDGRSPALTGDPGTCQYGEFDGTDDYIELPSGFPNLQSSFTVAAWIRPTSSLAHARIFADDENNSGGFALSLGDPGAGRLRFFSRGVSPVSEDTQGAVISVDTWHHVVAVHDASAQTRQIYVDGVAQQFSGGSTAPTYSGSWGTDSGPVSIGGETSGSSESSSNFHFEGQIDEVNVYESALSSSQIATLYAETHACSVIASVDHFDIDFGSSTASTCAPKTVTITACADSGCSSAFTSYTGTIALSTSSSHGTWAVTTGSGSLSPNPHTSDDGSASYTFSSSDNGVVVLTLSNAHADDLTITANDAMDSVSTTSSTVSFTDNAFVITPDPIQVAGRNQSTTATMWQRNGSDCSVATAYTGAMTLEAWLTRDASDPGGAAPTIGGTSVPNSASTSFSITFTNGVATFDLATTDVGRYILHLRDETRTFATGVDIDSDSVTLTTRPFGFDLDVTDSGGGANPAATGAGGSAFVAADEAFTVSARAVLWQAADDTDADGVPDGHADTDPDTGASLDDNTSAPSFGQETPAESVNLASRLLAPSGGTDPGISSSAITSFTSGAGSATDVAFDEVGIIEITADLGDDSYLGAANVVGASGYVGRFIPDHFQLSSLALNDRRDTATQSSCAASYTFLDERLELEFGVTARGAGGGTTQNYTGSFAKLTSVSSLGGASGISTNAINLVGSHGGSVYTPADRLTGTVPSISINNGTTSSTVTLSFEMDRLNSGGLIPEVPYTGIQFVVNPTDSDGVETNGTTMVTMPSGSENFTSIGTTNLYFGRIVVENAHGSELAPVPVWVHTEYCSAVDGTPECTQWTDLSRAASDDYCSRLAPAAPTDTSIDDYWQGGTSYGAGSEALFQVFDSVQNRGGGGFRMSYTGSGDGIQATVPDLGGDTVETFHDYLLLQQGIVTFGIYKGRDPVIYMREAY